jgi:hypothetical protein
LEKDFIKRYDKEIELKNKTHDLEQLLDKNINEI